MIYHVGILISNRISYNSYIGLAIAFFLDPCYWWRGGSFYLHWCLQHRRGSWLSNIFWILGLRQVTCTTPNICAQEGINIKVDMFDICIYNDLFHMSYSIHYR